MQVESQISVTDRVEDWEVSHNGKLIAGIDKEEITIWDLSNSRIRGKITKQSMIPSSIGGLGAWKVCFSPESNLMIVSFTMLQPPKSEEYDYLVYSSHWIWDVATVELKHQFDSEVYERELYLEDRLKYIVNHSNGVLICEKEKYFVSWGQVDSRCQHYDFWSLETGKYLFSQRLPWSEYVAVSSDKAMIWVGTDQDYYSFRVNPSLDHEDSNSYISEYIIYNDSYLIDGYDEEVPQYSFTYETIDNLICVSFTYVETKKTIEIKSNLSEVKVILVAESEIAMVGDERIELWSLESGELQGTYYITNKSQYKVQKSDDGITITHPTQPSMTVMFDTDDLS